jgi:hypothetical protein
MAQDIKGLEDLVDTIAKTANDDDRVSVGEIVEAVGSRSFGPLLLVAGVVMLSPLSGIPGLPTSMATLVLLISLQLLLGREYFWLPRWLLKRSVARDKLEKALKWLRPPARFIDRYLRPRLNVFVGRAGKYIIAVVCSVIALGMPVMELVPFSATAAGAILTAFGLSLIACDGLFALLAFVFTAGTVGLVVYHLL